MIEFRPGNQRGHTRRDWLDSAHGFSFGEYQDPARTRFSNLRVLNEDRIAPGGGFPMHGHRDMEILTLVLSGHLEHRDSLGNGAIIGPGMLQYMSAGAGVEHSEINPSASEPVHLLQIWLLPNRPGGTPTYAQRAVSHAADWQLLVSPDGRDGSIATRQDGLLYVIDLATGATSDDPLATGRRGYLHLATGQALVNGQPLVAGDALCVAGESLAVTAREPARLLLFDLP